MKKHYNFSKVKMKNPLEKNKYLFLILEKMKTSYSRFLIMKKIEDSRHSWMKQTKRLGAIGKKE